MGFIRKSYFPKLSIHTFFFGLSQTGLLFQQQYVFLQGARPNLSVTRAEVGSVPVAGCHLTSASKKTGRWSVGHSTFLTQVWKFRMVWFAFRANANTTCFHFWHSDWLGGAGCFVIRGQRCHCSSFFSSFAGVWEREAYTVQVGSSASWCISSVRLPEGVTWLD